MDSLVTLFQKRQYELIIKLTEQSDDELSLYFRLESFFNLEQYQNAIDLVVNKQLLFGEYTLRMMQIHLLSLLEINDYLEALKVVYEYETFPYISQEAEEFLQEAPHMIKEHEKKHRVKKPLTNQELTNLLLNPKDENDLILSLNLIRKRRINDFVKPLRHIVQDQLINDQLRTFSLMLLCEAKDNDKLDFIKNEKSFSLKPNEINLDSYQILFEELFFDLEQLTKNITIAEVSQKLFDQLFFLLFPDYVYDEQDFPYIKGALLVLAGEYLKTEIDVQELINKLKIDAKKLDEYTSKYRTLLDKSFAKVKKDN